MNSLKLSESWDLELDGAGNIALLDERLSVAQDVANRILTVKGEHFFDRERGIPVFSDVFGVVGGISLMNSLIMKEALKLNYVDQCYVALDLDNSTRKLKGSAFITDILGNQSTLNL